MTQIKTQEENKMGVMPVNKLLITMALPMMISMLVQAMYNIVDSYFVARLGEDALTAVSYAFPIQTLMISVGTGTGVGINSLLSRNLGEKKFKEANKVAVNGIFLAILSFLVFCIFAIVGATAFMEGQTKGIPHEEIVYGYGKTYLKIVTGFSLGIYMQFVFERLLQATGNTFYTMISQSAGAVINIILDPIFIFGLFGVPRMEVAGAAIATVIGQFVAAIIAIIFNLTKNKEISINMLHFRPNLRIIKNIYAVGLPSIVMQAIGSVMTLGMNFILKPFASAVAVFGVYFKLNSFIFMPVFGMNNGMVPIVAYNYGARNKKRITDTIKLGMKLSVSIMLIGAAIFQLLPDKLLGIFKPTDTMLEVGVPALRIIGLSFVFAGVCIILISTFQAFGEGMASLIISVARQLGVILPVAYFLAKTFGLPAAWFAFPMAEIVSLSLSILFFRRLYREKIKPMEEA